MWSTVVHLPQDTSLLECALADGWDTRTLRAGRLVVDGLDGPEHPSQTRSRSLLFEIAAERSSTSDMLVCTNSIVQTLEFPCISLKREVRSSPQCNCLPLRSESMDQGKGARNAQLS